MESMSRKIFCVFLFLVAWIAPISSQDTLKIADISRVMERLFHFHIESKQMSPSIIRRSVKIYIEQFDSEKAYLLESEVMPYFNMSEARTREILGHVQMKNYSDFIELNDVIANAILRAQQIRGRLAQQMASGSIVESFSSPSFKYPRSEQEIIDKQRSRMVRFYQFHQERTLLDSAQRKMGVFDLFEKKLRRYENNYLLLGKDGRPLPTEKTEHLISTRLLKAFAKSLDTHTAFFSPEEAYEMRLSLEKQFEGVGVILSEGIDGVMIADLIEGSPAAQSGQIQVNDLLVEIDGKALTAESFEEVLDLLKKRDHSEITLGFKRPGSLDNKESFFRVSLRKRPIAIKGDRIKSSYEIVEGGIIGKIALNSFYESSDGISSEKDIKEAIRNFRSKGELKGLVLDLRENSGGFLGQAVRVAGLFVSNGVIVISKYGKGDVHYLRNTAGKSYFGGPLVVLTSKMSASASEIVAQALQDYGVALIVGDERTFGKGSIQYQTITDESADLFFKVTVGRYYTVSGRSTQIEGVIADIVVPTQYAPYNIGERYLEYPLSQDKVASAYTDPLTDLDEKTRFLFEKRYMPNLQKVYTLWKKNLHALKKNSAARIAGNPQFEKFLHKMEKVKARQSKSMVNSVDEPIEMTLDDLQMQEAVNVVKDMIQIHEEMAAPKEVLAPTGSDS
jgi:carboxyl-terminal processing protease